MLAHRFHVMETRLSAEVSSLPFRMVQQSDKRMPIDFARVPPRKAVPPPPQLSKRVWTALLVVLLCFGAALTLVLWPQGRTINPIWFWFCLVGYPMLSWTFMLCLRLGYLHARRSEALAVNHVSDCEMERCHAIASVPLALIGHTWRFSANRDENDVQGVVDGSLRLKTRTGGAKPNTDVDARWIEIPNQEVHSGNELTEYSRHRLVCNWLLAQLIEDLTPQFAALSAGTTLHFEAVSHCALKSIDVSDRLEKLVIGKFPGLRMIAKPSIEPSSVFGTDALLDSMRPGVVHLLVAVQLREAVSERLQDGAAEAGVALLLGHPSIAEKKSEASALLLHRPARGQVNTIGETLDNAMRWGKATSANVGALWSHGISPEIEVAIRSSSQVDGKKSRIDLRTTVGDCGVAGGWFATALAAEFAARTGDPQLVLTQEDRDLIALVCRKQA
ncbi:conserved hypothetical protein [Paraburkholderia atlantica]|uniref:Transmembrane protein n=1 Tax=Paraburkholderia atlantica TaxID=2654982 RepID=D5WIH4_PARAM|nr:conserved hypothetical protein [Paraburkholderia atlantica]